MSRTTATLVLAGVGLWLLSVLRRPSADFARGSWWQMASLIALVVVSPQGRQFFALSVPPPEVIVAGIGLVVLAGVALEIAARLSGLWSSVKPHADTGRPIRPADHGPLHPGMS